MITLRQPIENIEMRIFIEKELIVRPWKSIKWLPISLSCETVIQNHWFNFILPSGDTTVNDQWGSSRVKYSVNTGVTKFFWQIKTASTVQGSRGSRIGEALRRSPRHSATHQWWWICPRRFRRLKYSIPGKIQSQVCRWGQNLMDNWSMLVTLQSRGCKWKGRWERTHVTSLEAEFYHWTTPRLWWAEYDLNSKRKRNRGLQSVPANALHPPQLPNKISYRGS